MLFHWAKSQKPGSAKIKQQLPCKIIKNRLTIIGVNIQKVLKLNQRLATPRVHHLPPATCHLPCKISSCPKNGPWVDHIKIDSQSSVPIFNIKVFYDSTSCKIAKKHADWPPVLNMSRTQKLYKCPLITQSLQLRRLCCLECSLEFFFTKYCTERGNKGLLLQYGAHGWKAVGESRRHFSFLLDGVTRCRLIFV